MRVDMLINKLSKPEYEDLGISFCELSFDEQGNLETTERYSGYEKVEISEGAKRLLIRLNDLPATQTEPSNCVERETAGKFCEHIKDIIKKNSQDEKDLYAHVRYGTNPWQVKFVGPDSEKQFCQIGYL